MHYLVRIIGVAAVCLGATEAVAAVTLRCPPDSKRVGNACVDTYEASVWQISPTNTLLVKQVQAGTVSLVQLLAGGATQLSPATSCSPAYPTTFPEDGNWVAVPGVSPS